MSTFLRIKTLKNILNGIILLFGTKQSNEKNFFEKYMALYILAKCKFRVPSGEKMHGTISSTFNTISDASYCTILHRLPLLHSTEYESFSKVLYEIYQSLRSLTYYANTKLSSFGNDRCFQVAHSCIELPIELEYC